MSSSTPLPAEPTASCSRCHAELFEDENKDWRSWNVFKRVTCPAGGPHNPVIKVDWGILDSWLQDLL